MGTTLTRYEEAKGIARLILYPAARQRIEAFLPEGVDIERVLAATQMASKANPDLIKCTGDSIIQSIAHIYAKGGEVGITSYLVPFKDGDNKNEDGSQRYICTPIDDYKFLAQLMVATGAVKHVQADVVLEGEPFEYERGTHPRIMHKPFTKKRVGAAIEGAYVVLYLPFDRFVPEHMSIDEIEAIRAKSKQWRHARACPVWYAKKTVVRRVAKTALTNPRLAKLFGSIVQQIELEERAEFGGDEVGVIEAGEIGNGHARVHSPTREIDEGSPAQPAEEQSHQLSEEEEEALIRAEERRMLAAEQGG